MFSIFLPSLFIVAVSAQEVTNYIAAARSSTSTRATALTNAAALSTSATALTDIDSSTLTGTALSAAESAGTALSASIYGYLGAETSLTGAALSAAISDNLGAEISLTGTALSAESAAIASEEAAFTSAYPSAAQTGPVVDACGPKVPDPSVPDSCDTPIAQSVGPAAYGVQCLNDTTTSTPLNLTSCAILIPELCANQWQNPDNWVWLSANDCSVGSWLPGSDFAGHAPWPSQTQCEELIYASMIDSCEYNETPYNIASVNLKVLPSDLPRDQTGEQVNVGYGSYVVSSQQLRTYSDKKDCTWIPPEDFCKGGGCYPASYYQSKFQKPTPCAFLTQLAISVTQTATVL